MLTKLAGGTIYDPSQGLNGVVADIYIRDGLIADDPGPGSRFDEIIDAAGHIVMAGGIDIHSHIAGGNVNTARMLLPEQFLASHDERGGLLPVDRACFTTSEIGRFYAEMGYTTVIEPAILPCNARNAHLQMGDIPYIDKGGLVILGNDDLLLSLLRDRSSQAEINDYVAWMLDATKCLGLKCINAGGGAAFKSNVRAFSLDDTVPGYGLSSRKILQALHRAQGQLGVPHPLHVHCNNLGIAGNIDTILATMEAAEGAPMHLAHVQFYAYGSEGPHGFSSATARLIEGLKKHPNITIDIGQVLFGQTVTISGGVIAQYSHVDHAEPKKWVIWDGECEGGGGVVPYRYRPQSLTNALQWAIGLELFLLAEDPWRVFFTTDHPNGAPFTRYPELLRLLMDREFRLACLDTIHPEARQMTLLGEIKREFSLYEIAIMTRAAPAQLLGLPDRGSLRPGSKADVAVYERRANSAATFAHCRHLLKDGVALVRDSKLCHKRSGKLLSFAPDFDRSADMMVRQFMERFSTVSARNFVVQTHEFA